MLVANLLSGPVSGLFSVPFLMLLKRSLELHALFHKHAVRAAAAQAESGRHAPHSYLHEQIYTVHPVDPVRRSFIDVHMHIPCNPLKRGYRYCRGGFISWVIG